MDLAIFGCPRNKTYQIKIEYNGKMAESKIATFEVMNYLVNLRDSELKKGQPPSREIGRVLTLF